MIVGEVVLGGQPWTLLQRDDFQASLRQFVGHNAGHQAGANRDNINFLVLCHGAVS
jgi:hypothetical protein